jgi:hypothetical protein
MTKKGIKLCNASEPNNSNCTAKSSFLQQGNGRKDVLKLPQPWLFIPTNNVRQSRGAASVLRDLTTAANSSARDEGPNAHAAVAKSINRTVSPEFPSEQSIL